MNRRKNCGIKKRLHRYCVSNSDLTGWNMASGTAFEKFPLEREIAFRDRHEKTIIQFQKIRHDLPQDKIFVDTLDGRFLVRHTIAAARMQETMVAAGGTERDFPTFDHGDA